MLSLHTTFKSFAFGFSCIIIFASCSSDSKKETEIIKALNESIENSNRLLLMSSTDVLVSLRNKTEELSTKERAQVWYPRAEKVQQLSKEVVDYIENIKQKTKDSSINSTELLDKLKRYRQQILQVDSKISNQFEKSLPVFTRSIDSSKNGQEKLFKDYFENTSSEAAVAMLNKIKNNIRNNELRIITFCNEQCGVTVFGPCSPDLPIAVQNSTIVRPGEKIEITTGICSFYTTINPEVFVYEKPVSVGPDAWQYPDSKQNLNPVNTMCQ